MQNHCCLPWSRFSCWSLHFLKFASSLPGWKLFHHALRGPRISIALVDRQFLGPQVSLEEFFWWHNLTTRNLAKLDWLQQRILWNWFWNLHPGSVFEGLRLCRTNWHLYWIWTWRLLWHQNQGSRCLLGQGWWNKPQCWNQLTSQEFSSLLQL